MKKKFLSAFLALMLLCACAAHAAPQVSGSLFSAAKQAVGYLVSGEYERLVTLLPFSGVAPSAAEWESFARNFSNRGSVQRDYAVAYWKGGCWRVAVPVQVPDNNGVETLLLTSDDGSTFTGYKYATWGQVMKDCSGSDHVVWNEEYVGGSAQLYGD